MDPVLLDVIVLEPVCVVVSVDEAVIEAVWVEVRVEEEDSVRIRLVLGVPVSVLVSELVEEGVLVPVGV